MPILLKHSQKIEEGLFPNTFCEARITLLQKPDKHYEEGPFSDDRSEMWGWALPEVNVTQDRLIPISFVGQCFFPVYFHSDLKLELYVFKCHYQQTKTAL